MASGKWWRRVVVVLAAGAALVGVTGVPAHALTSVTESFESPTSFTTDSGGAISGAWYQNCSLAHTGCGGVIMRVHAPGSWVGAKQTWFISAFPNIADCSVGVYAKRQPTNPFDSPDPASPSTAFRLEVINPNTFGYVAVRDVALTGTAWTPVGVSFQTIAGGNVLVRATVLASADGIRRTVNVDDLSLKCVVELEGRG